MKNTTDEDVKPANEQPEKPTKERRVRRGEEQTGWSDEKLGNFGK